MTDGKKDLTRIEDMDELVHAEGEADFGVSFEDEAPPFEIPAEEDSPPELPELPAEEDSPGLDVSAFSDEAQEAKTEEPLVDEVRFDEPQFDEPQFDEPQFDAPQFDAPKFDGPKFDDSFLSEPTAVITPPETTRTEMVKPDPLPVAPVFEATPEVPAPVIEESFDRPRENFAEVRSFAEHAVLADVSAESNPPFSLMAHNVTYLEDSEDILTILREVKFPEDMLESFRKQLERGSLLVPRVSEYTAIYLAHRLRRFRLELQVGPSDILHPPRAQDDTDRGLVSKRSLSQNQHHHFNFREGVEDTKQIILSTMPHLDGYVIERYLGVASEHAFLKAEQVEDEVSGAINASYDELAQKLKGHALHHRANAVVGINYQLTPMPAENPALGHYRYKLTCTGNLVWAHRP